MPQIKDVPHAVNQLVHTCRFERHGAFGEPLPNCRACGQKMVCGPFEHGCINPQCPEGKENARVCLLCKREVIYCCC